MTELYSVTVVLTTDVVIEADSVADAVDTLLGNRHLLDQVVGPPSQAGTIHVARVVGSDGTVQLQEDLGPTLMPGWGHLAQPPTPTVAPLGPEYQQLLEQLDRLEVPRD